MFKQGYTWYLSGSEGSPADLVAIRGSWENEGGEERVLEVGSNFEEVQFREMKE